MGPPVLQFRATWSVDHRTGVYTGLPSPTGIAGDPALTSYGVDQAHQLGRHLATLDPKVDRVYSSPFYRCLQTMQPFMQQQQQQQCGGSVDKKMLMLPEHGIREWFGAAPFDHPEPAEPGTLKAMFPSLDESYVSAVRPSRRGETLDQLQERVAAALKAIIMQCDADGARAVVLCSHAAVIILMGRILTGRIPPSVDADDFHAFTCGLSVYGRADPGNATVIHDNRDGRQGTVRPYIQTHTHTFASVGDTLCCLVPFFGGPLLL